MASSPYQPPNARVEDPAPSVDRKRPPLIDTIVALMWGAFLLYIPSTFLILVSLPKLPPLLIVIIGVFVLVMTILTIWLYASIARGRNWARITFSLLTAGATAIIALDPSAQFKPSVAGGVIGMIIQILNIAVVFLLFSRSARPWFRRDAQDTA